MSVPRRLVRVALACAALVSCIDSDADAVDSREAVQLLAFDTATVYVAGVRDTLRLRAEVARTTEQKTMGLTERPSLADTAGMLFVYDADEPANSGFWMFRTRIPLDIAFADSTGRIVAIRQMVPCEARLAAGCPSYEPGQPYRVALEVNSGLLSRHGVAVGSRLWSAVLPSSMIRGR